LDIEAKEWRGNDGIEGRLREGMGERSELEEKNWEKINKIKR